MKQYASNLNKQDVFRPPNNNNMRTLAGHYSNKNK